MTEPNGTTAADVEELRALGYDDGQVFAITLFVALRQAFSTVNDALGAEPDAELVERVPTAVRAAVDYGRQARSHHTHSQPGPATRRVSTHSDLSHSG